MVDGVYHNHWEEAVLQRLVEQLELAGTVVGLHSFIILILLNLKNIVIMMSFLMTILSNHA